MGHVGWVGLNGNMGFIEPRCHSGVAFVMPVPERAVP
jgi:hypothetical protein